MTAPADAPGGMAAGYSLDNARKFGWGSISGDLHPERLAHLETYLIGPRVLDAGCGGGGFVHFLSEHGFAAYGADLHPEFLNVARRQGWRGALVQADLSRLPFADQTFDTTFCFDVLEHVDDRAVIRELARVTKKRLILAVPREDEIMGAYSLTFRHYQDKTHLRNYTPESLDVLARGVRPAAVHVFPELLVPARELALRLLQKNDWLDLRNEIGSALDQDVCVPAPPFVAPPAPPVMLPPVLVEPMAWRPQTVAGETPRLSGHSLWERLLRRVALARPIRKLYAAAYEHSLDAQKQAADSALEQADQTRAACQAACLDVCRDYQTAVAGVFQEWGGAYEAAYQRHSEALTSALRSRRADEACDLAVRRFLEESAYAPIPTGLVAVVDLA